MVALAAEIRKRWPTENYRPSDDLIRASERWAENGRTELTHANIAALWGSAGIDALRVKAFQNGLVLYQFRIEPPTVFRIEKEADNILDVTDLMVWDETSNLADVVAIGTSFYVVHTTFTSQPVTSLSQKTIPNLARAMSVPTASLLDLDVLSDEIVRLSLQQAHDECGYETLEQLNRDLVKVVSKAVNAVNDTNTNSDAVSGGNLVAVFTDILLEQDIVKRCPAFLHSQFSAGLSYQAVYSGSRLLALVNLAYVGKLVEKYRSDEEQPNLGKAVIAHIEFLRTASALERLDFFRNFALPKEWLRVKQYNRSLLSAVTDGSAAYLSKQMTRLGLQTEESFKWLPEDRLLAPHVIKIVRETYNENLHRYAVGRTYLMTLDHAHADANVPLRSWAAGIETCTVPVSWNKEWWRICNPSAVEMQKLQIEKGFTP